MIQITDNAKAELKRLLNASVDWPEARLRLVERSQGALGLGIDIKDTNDEVVEYEGDSLLLIESNLASRLDSILLDIDATAEGPVFVICEQ